MRVTVMTVRETKMKKILARLEEIEKLQSDLRRIVPRKTTEQVIRRSSIVRNGHWSSSNTISGSDKNYETSDVESFEFPAKKLVNGITGVSVETERVSKIGDSCVLDDSELEASLTRSVLPQSVKSSRKKSVHRELFNSDVEDDIASDISIEEIGKMVDASVQTKKRDKFDLETFDLLDYFRLPEESEESFVNAIVQTLEPSGSPGIGHKNVTFSDNTTKGLGKFVNVSVQTAATKQEVGSEPFDILNYFHLSDEVTVKEKDDPNKEQHCGVSPTFHKILKGPSNRSELRPLGFLEIIRPSKISKEIRNPKEEMHDNVDQVGSSPLDDVNLIGFGDKPRRAAAVAWRTPAGPTKERQQVHASEGKGSTEGDELVPWHLRRRQRTRGYRRDEAIRVPVRNHRPGEMIEPASHIETESSLSRRMRDCKENKLNQKQKEITRPQRERVQQDHAGTIGSPRPGRNWSGLWRKASDAEETKEKPDWHDGVLQRCHEPGRQAKHRKSLMEWTLAIGTRYRLGSKGVMPANRQWNLENEVHRGLDHHHQQMTQAHQSVLGKRAEGRKGFQWKARIKSFGWGSVLGCSNGGASRRRRAGVVVRDHYPGDRTPQLVNTESIDVSDRRTETLRVISSATKVCIRRGNKVTDSFFNRR